MPYFHSGPATSFFLGLRVVVLCSSPGAYWTPSNLGDSSFSVISFCLFIQFMRFSWQVYWGGWPFLSPEDHILSELSTLTHPSWVILYGMAHIFTELSKTLLHDKTVMCEETSSGTLEISREHFAQRWAKYRIEMVRPSRSRRDQEEMERIHGRTVQKRS